MALQRSVLILFLFLRMHGDLLAQDTTLDLSGLWKDGDSIIRLSQSGNHIEAVYSQPSRKLTTGGIVAGDRRFFGTLSGRTLRGTYIGRFPAKYKRLCPEQWQQQLALELTVSPDADTLQGRWKDARIFASDCRVKIDGEGWRQLTLSRLVQAPAEVVRIVAPHPPFLPIETIPVGGIFRVEVTYDEGPGRAQVVVTIRVKQGGAVIQAIAKPTDVPQAYRTGPIRVVQPIQP